MNVSNQPLGGFATNFSGEPVSVQTMPFEFTTSGTIGGAITSVTLVDPSGAVVAGPVDATVAGNTQYVTFTDTVTFPIGRAVYTLEGKLPTGAANGATVVASTTPSNWGNVTGQTTGNNVIISTTAFAMNTMTVKGATLAVNISAQPTSQSIVAGVQNFVLANYTLDASQSGEDVRLSSLPVYINGNVTTQNSAITDLTGCALFNGTTQLDTGSRVVNSPKDSALNTFSFDNSLVVPKGTVTTLSLECNIASSPTNGSYTTLADQTLTDYNVTGQVSGNTVGSGTGLTVGSNSGGTMTVTTGGLAMSIDPSSPSYTVISGGTTGQTVAIVKLRASNEAMTLTKLGLNLATGTASDIIDATIYNGSTQVGSLQFNQGVSFATSSLTTTVSLPKDTDVLLTIKADFASVGTSQSGTEGKLVKVDPLNAEATGQSSGSTLDTSAPSGTDVAGVRVFKSYPTVTLDTLSGTGVSDGRLMDFRVTASSAGPVGIDQIKFSVSTTTATVTNLALYAYTDAGYSSPISGVVNGQIDATKTVIPTGSAIIFVPSTPVQVPSGSTLYFQLRASVSGVQSGSSVVATLLGDSSYSSVAAGTPTGSTAGYFVNSATALVGTSTNSFIWSGNATSTAGVSDVDWSNGFGLPGFSSSGMIQTRSN